VPKIPVQAEIVHVDLVVTDKRGRLVTGLGPQDFVLLEDGKAVDVVGFSAPGPATRAGAGAEARSLGEPPREPRREAVAR
jgi:hypothetical protein